MKTLLLIIGITFLGLTVNGQEKDLIKGIVKDEQKQPVPGVSVGLKYNNRFFSTTMSDVEGKYELIVPDTLKNFVIEYSFIGFEKKEIVVDRTQKKEDESK